MTIADRNVKPLKPNRSRITPGCAGIWTDDETQAWRRLTDFVHAESAAKIGVQIGHSGRKGSTKVMREGIDEPLADGNWEVVAPSPLALRSCETQVCPRPNNDLCASPRGRSMECGRGRSHPPKLQRESAPRARPIEWATRDLE